VVGGVPRVLRVVRRTFARLLFGVGQRCQPLLILQLLLLSCGRPSATVDHRTDHERDQRYPRDNHHHDKYLLPRQFVLRHQSGKQSDADEDADTDRERFQ